MLTIKSLKKMFSQHHENHGVHVVILIFLLAAIPVVTAVYHDWHRLFITTPDGDIVFAYEALRLNAGLSQHTTVHPGYTHYVMLAWWLKLLGVLGLASVQSLQDLPALTSPEFETAYEEVIFSVRYFLAAFCALFVAIFYLGIQYLLKNQVISLIITLLFATSVGLETHALMTYPELISVFFYFLAFMILVCASRSTHWITLKMYFCGLFVVLALLAKVQAIPLVLALPVLALLFGPPMDAKSAKHLNYLPTRKPLLVFNSVLAVSITIPISVMVISSIANNGGSGMYQVLTALFIIGSVVLYSALYKTGTGNGLAALFGLLGGVSLGFYATLLYPNVAVIDGISNFMDVLYDYGGVGRGTENASTLSWTTILEKLVDGIYMTLTARFFTLNVMDEPLRLLNWLVLISCGLCLKFGLFRTFLQIIALMGLSILTESVFSLYRVEHKVLVYFDLPLLIATALALKVLFDQTVLRPLRYGTVGALFIIACVQGVNLTSDTMIARPYPPSISCSMSKVYMAPIAKGFERYCDDS